MSQEQLDQKPHLLKLTGPMNLNPGPLIEAVAEGIYQYSCEPSLATETFLKFPFSDTGERINCASDDLIVFDHE